MAGSFLTRIDYAAVFALGAGSPSWTRLEPQSVTGDPTPGLEARVHDPLWLLCRQWQLGEFEGDDAGSPLGVELAVTSNQLSRWQACDWTQATPKPVLPLPAGTLLEPIVEDEPARAPGLRDRAEAGALFLAQLHDTGLDGLIPSVVDNTAFVDEPSTDPFDTAWAPMIALLAGRAVDAERLAQSLTTATAAAQDLPPWLTPDADARDRIVQLCADWLASYRGTPATADSDAWVGQHLEYAFSVAAGGPTGETVLRAPAFGGGAIDWYDFDVDNAPADLFGAPDDLGESAVLTRYATPLRFAGMPADRLWQFEDAQVNLGDLQVEPHDLARLLLVEYALSYGNDWLVVPVDVPYGSITTINWLTYTTTFGERFLVEPTRASRRNDGWQMFTIAPLTSGAPLDRLFIPPAVTASDEGAAQEDVMYLRDENANLAWAVEKVVTAPSGEQRSRGDEPAMAAPPDGDTAVDLDYRLQIGVPPNWIPYLPQSSGYGAIKLGQGRMTRDDGSPVDPVGVLLNDPGMQVVADEDVPREGAEVRRVPMLARRVDGSYVRWTARRVTLGRGEGSSGLAFDDARRRSS